LTASASGVDMRIDAAIPQLALYWRQLKVLVRPARLLWPWLLSTVIFFIFLKSSQGQALTWQMENFAWYRWITLAAVSLSFIATLSASLLTSLVVLSWKPGNEVAEADESKQSEVGSRADSRSIGILHISWAIALSSAPNLLVAWAARSAVALAVAAVLGLFALLLLHAYVLRGTSCDPVAWANRLEQLRRRRVAFAFGVAALATTPLLFGAFALVDVPESAMLIGPIFVTMLGLSALSSLFAAVFVALPHCTPFPNLVALAPLALVVTNVAYKPIADAENPLLKQISAEAAARADPESAQASSCSRVQRSLVRALQDQAARAVTDSRSTDAVPAMYFVSAEGGGVRAAYWTAMGLANLEDTIPDFKDRIATMSGVSGGSLGIATWLAAIESTNTLEARRHVIHQFLSSDLLTPAIAGLLFLDTPRLIFGPLWYSARRDDVFEAAIVNRWKHVAGRDADFFVRPLIALCFRNMKHPPTVYFGATEVLMGAFAPMGNTNFGMPGGGRLFINGLLRQSDFISSNVVRSVVMSARFPFLSPTADVAVTLENVHNYLATDRWIRVKMNDGKTPGNSLTIRGSARLGMLVDGGYFDNSGLTMTRYALDVLGQHVVPPRNAVRTPGEHRIDRSKTSNSAFEARGIVATHVVHFSNDPSSACVEPSGWEETASADVREAIERSGFKPRCRFEVDELEALFRPRWFSWLSSPVETILAVRAGHAAHELNSMELQLLTRRYPSALINYALAGELTRQLCKNRSSLSFDRCMSAGRQFGPNWRGELNEDALPTGQDIRRRAADCNRLSQKPPLPLGWSLHAQDTSLMQCLAANAALNARLRVEASEDDYRFIAATHKATASVGQPQFAPRDQPQMR